MIDCTNRSLLVVDDNFGAPEGVPQVLSSPEVEDPALDELGAALLGEEAGPGGPAPSVPSYLVRTPPTAILGLAGLSCRILLVEDTPLNQKIIRRTPERSGATVKMRESGGYDRPIVVLTARAMTEDSVRCLRAGFDAHPSRPFLRKAPVETIRAHQAR